MKRGLIALFALLLLGLVTSAVVAQHADRDTANAPHRLEVPPCLTYSCTPTPVHQSNGGNHGNSGDEDGDGIPDGIDLCPNQSGPASNQGCPPGGGSSAAPTGTPTPQLPLLPTSGDCVMATLMDEPVNVRSTPSTSAAIVAQLDPIRFYPVDGLLDTGNGIWVLTDTGWVASWVVRMGGSCADVPRWSEAGPYSIVLVHPDGFALTLDKGNSPGQDSAQGFCSTGFGIDVPDGSITHVIHFSFGDPSAERCIKLHDDAQGFDIMPSPDDKTGVPVNWYVGYVNNALTVVALLQPGSDHAHPSFGLMLSWTLPPACKQGDPSCPAAQNLDVNWSLEPPPDPDMPGALFSWGMGAGMQSLLVHFSPNVVTYFPDGASVDKNGIIIIGGSPSNATTHGIIIIGGSPSDPNTHGIIIIGGSPSDATTHGIIIIGGSPSDPSFQGYGIDGVQGAALDRIEFALPAVQ